MTAQLVLYVLGLLAAGCGVYGAFLFAQGLAGDRAVERRLTRGRAAQVAELAPEAKAAETAEGPFARLIDERAPWLRRWLAAAGSPFTPLQTAVASVGLTLVFLILLMVLGVPAPVALGLALWGGLAGPLLAISFLAKRRRALFLSQLPPAVDLIARSLQAGHPVTTAMSVAASQMPDPLGPEFGKVLAEISYGLDRDAAFRNMLQRFPLADLQMLAASLEVTRETGGNVAEVLLTLGDTLRAKQQLKKKVEAISAEGRLSFWVITSMPVAVGGAILVLRPDYYGDVASDPLFWPMMMVPPLLLAAGAFAIWKMISFKV